MNHIAPLGLTRLMQAGDLPAELRGKLDPATLVRVTVVPSTEAERAEAVKAALAAADRLSDAAAAAGFTEADLAEILAEAKAERIAARERGER